MNKKMMFIDKIKTVWYLIIFGMLVFGTGYSLGLSNGMQENKSFSEITIDKSNK